MKIDLNELEALARAATPGPWDSEGVAIQAGIDRTIAVTRFPQMIGAVAMKDARRNTEFIAAANPAAVLELIALARQAAVTEAVAIPLVSEEQALACAAQPGQQPAQVETIGKHKPFQLAVSSIRRDWTIGGVRHLTSIVDSYVAQRAARVSAPVPAASMQPFQQRVQPWMMACFGAEISADKEERNHRFFEESTELVQACGMTASEAHQLVDYVYGRPVGEPAQAVGGVMVTLAALCLANGLDMDAAAETELARIWTKVEAIRAKQAAKPKHSPLPQGVQPASGRDAALLEQAAQACDQQADGTNGPYRSAWLQCANALRALRDTVHQSTNIRPTSQRDLIVARAIRDAMFNGWNPCREDSDLRGVLAALDKRGA